MMNGMTNHLCKELLASSCADKGAVRDSSKLEE